MITGTIPTKLGTLPEMRVIELQHNHLKGLIPSEIGQLYMLSYLLLQENQLTGSLPASVQELSLMKALNMTGNPMANPICEANTSYFGSQQCAWEFPKAFSCWCSCSCKQQCQSKCSSKVDDWFEPIVVVAISLEGGMGRF